MTEGDIRMRRLRKNHDFSDFGKAIKAAREAKGIKREPAAEALDLSPRYLMALENNGKNPSGQVLVALAKMFDVSIDQHIFSYYKIIKEGRNVRTE